MKVLWLPYVFTAVLMAVGGTFLRPALAQSDPVAAPVAIVSTPILIGEAGDPWRYDEDGLPDAVGVPPFVWSLAENPDDANINNKTGEIYWLPMEAGPYSWTLVVQDATGAEATQSFIVDVDGPIAPQFTLTPPAEGYSLEIGEIHWLTNQTSAEGLSKYVLPHTGTPPIYFSSSDSGCMVVLGDGTYAVGSPIEQTCEVVVTAVNVAGVAELHLVLNFVSPYADDVMDCLNADRAEGTVPMRVRISGEECVPGNWDEATWATRFSFHSGEPLDAVHEVAEPIVNHTYTTPGTYQVRFLVWGNWLEEQDTHVPASLGSLPWYQGIADSEHGAEGALTITVLDAEERRPPQVTLSANVVKGESPLTVEFTTETILGDEDIVSYSLHFGDGSHYSPTVGTGGTDVWRRPHAFVIPGVYQARVEVLDSLGLRASAGLDITVTDRGRVPPYGYARATPGRGEAPLTVALVAEVGDPDGYVVERYWKLHDGTNSTSDEPEVTLNEPGEYVMTLVVQDDQGLSSKSVALVEVTRDGTLPPTIVSAPARIAWVGKDYSYDNDGLPLATGGGPYVWSFGADAEGAGMIVPEGMQIDERTGELRWTPTESQVGSHRVRIGVQNVSGTDAQQFVIDVQAPAPLGIPGASGDAQRGCACAAGGPWGDGGAPVLLLGAAWVLGATALRRRRRTVR